MKYHLLGEFLKECRERVGLSQAEIGRDGFMSQSKLSRIEKGDGCPTMDDLIYLCQLYHESLLSVLPYLHDHEQEMDINQLENKRNLMLKMEKALQEDQFLELKKWVKLAAKLPAFNNPMDQPLMNWLSGIVVQELDEDYDKAHYYLHLARDESERTKQKERTSEILNSFGVAFIKQCQPEKAKQVLTEALSILESLPPTYSSQYHKIYVRILYNLSIVFYQLEQFHESIYFTKRALQISRQHDSTYLIGETTFQYGLSQYHTGNLDEAHLHLFKAYTLFDVFEKDQYKVYTANRIHEFRLK